MKYFIKTFGCQMNEHDVEILAGMLETEGYQAAQDTDDADLIVIHTCCVRESAENKILGFIGNLKKMREWHPGLVIAVSGCMVQQPGAAEKLIKRSPHVDIIIGTHNLHRLPYLIQKVAEERPLIEVWPQEDVLQEDMPVKRTEGIKAQVNIMYGCNNFCSYCIVPYVRGRERSRRPGEIEKEIRLLGEQGFKEVLLLGQNVNSYGLDFDHSFDFADLLVRLNSIPGIERVRYMTSHPRDFSRKLIRTIAGLDKVCEHFHLPIQSGSNRILQLMNRGYTREAYLDLLAEIRDNFPNASVTTDIIVGFPGETDADFNDTMRLMEEACFDAAYTFLYSRRSGTPAAEMPGQVSAREKKEHLQALMALQNGISLKINEKLVGQREEILVEGPSRTRENILTGRTRTNKIVVFPGDAGLKSLTVPVKILKAKTWNLEGQVIN